MIKSIVEYLINGDNVDVGIMGIDVLQFIFKELKITVNAIQGKTNNRKEEIMRKNC